MVNVKDAMDTPNRPEESENEAGYQAMLLTLDWKEGSAGQHLVIEVERLPAQNLNKHYSSKSCPFQKTLPNQYCSNQEVKSSQEVSVWPH